MSATSNEEQVRDLIEKWAEGVSRRDIDAILADHSPDIVMFDVPPPAKREGLDAYRASWEHMFPWLGHDGAFHLRETSIEAGDQTAFVHALVDCRGTDNAGRAEMLTVRLTIGLRRIDDTWVVTHEHHSEPSDK